MRRLDVDTVKKVLALKAAGIGRRRISWFLGINTYTASDICRRVNWKHVPLQPPAELPPELQGARKPLPTRERLMKRVRQTETCWLWTGKKAGNGYGQFIHDGDFIGAHRAAWMVLRGPIPTGMYVLHRCDVPLCINPDHLFLGTHRDNMRDMTAKGRHKSTRAALAKSQAA